MIYLFIDSTEELKLGILNSKFEWLEYVATDNKRSSGVLHALIEKMLSKIKKTISDINGVIYSSGPGSYTGMRVAEGCAQIFNWQGTPIYSFYHYEVPKMLGIEKGCWINSAFKGEVFIYSWNKKKEEFLLVKEDELQVTTGKVYTSSYTKIKAEKTSQLIFEQSSNLFKNIVAKKMRRKPYYYRAIDQEFSRST